MTEGLLQRRFGSWLCLAQRLDLRRAPNHRIWTQSHLSNKVWRWPSRKGTLHLQDKESVRELNEFYSCPPHAHHVSCKTHLKAWHSLQAGRLRAIGQFFWPEVVSQNVFELFTDKTSHFQQSKSEKVLSQRVAPSKADSSSMAATSKVGSPSILYWGTREKRNRTIMLCNPIAESCWVYLILLRLVTACCWMPMVLCLCTSLFSSWAMDTEWNQIMSGLLIFLPFVTSRTAARSRYLLPVASSFRGRSRS